MGSIRVIAVFGAFSILGALRNSTQILPGHRDVRIEGFGNRAEPFHGRSLPGKRSSQCDLGGCTERCRFHGATLC